MTESIRDSLVFGLALIALLIQGTTVHAMPRSSLASIHVVAPENPTHIPLRVGSLSSAIALGLTAGPGATAGELAGSAGASGRDTKLTESVAGKNLRMGDELAKAIADALQRKGFGAAVATSGQQPQSPTARLTASIEEAAYERRAWGKIGPKLVVQVRVHDVASGDRLFADTYKYDMYAQTIGWTILRPPPEYGFEEAEEVTAHPEIVVAGFRTGFQMIADRVADDIVSELDD
jgi:hypothetical protein